MTATKAHLEGNQRHQAKLMRIILQPYREEGQTIKEAASKAGQSTQAYILQAVRERMEKEKAVE